MNAHDDALLGRVFKGVFVVIGGTILTLFGALINEAVASRAFRENHNFLTKTELLEAHHALEIKTDTALTQILLEIQKIQSSLSRLEKNM